MTSPPDPPSAPPRPDDPAAEPDLLDEALEGTFPASDPVSPPDFD